MAALEGNVKVPVIGNVPKKAAAGGLLVVGTLVVVYYVRKRNAAAAGTAASGSTAADQYPPDGTTGNPQDPYSTDPATNQTYGDEAAGSGGTYGAYSGVSAQTDTYPWDGTTGNEADPYSLDPGSGITYGDEGLASGGTGTGGTGGPPFANNSAWENWAVQQLITNDPGISQANLTTALGLYLNGQPVSPADKTLIFDATGTAGDPPVAGPNGYPPKVRTDGSKGGGSGTVTVPDVKGQPQEAAYALIAQAGLKPEGSKDIHGKVLFVVSQTPAAGRKVAHGSKVTLVSKPKTTVRTGK